MRRLPLILCPLLILLSLVPTTTTRAQTTSPTYDFTVAQDGSGNFTTVQAAIDAVPEYKATRTTIFIKAGTYYEKLKVIKSIFHLSLIGENRDTTILTYDDHAIVNPDESVTGTQDTPSMFVRGKDFAAMNLTFANTAGDVGPAIALWIQGSHPHFRNCAFLGYQDTLCCFAQQAYFKKCYVEGAIDFIFGRSTAVFKGCTIYCLDYGFITASDTDADKAYGFVFRNCRITGSAPAGSVLLGRAWGDYAKVAFINCTMDDLIAPEGWDDWDDDAAQDTVDFAEYGSTGDGADPAERVDWSHQLTAEEADGYDLRSVFGLSAGPENTTMLLAAPVPWYEAF